MKENTVKYRISKHGFWLVWTDPIEGEQAELHVDGEFFVRIAYLLSHEMDFRIEHERPAATAAI
jgi:hypothetical protein